MPIIKNKIELPLDGSEAVDILVEQFPKLSIWLRDQGLICIQCGELYWGPLVDLYRTSRRVEEEYIQFMSAINQFLSENANVLS